MEFSFLNWSISKERLRESVLAAEACSASTQLVELAFYSSAAFFIPILLQSHQQLVVGTVVNAMLLAGAFYIKGAHRLLPLVVLPSLGAVVAGALFGGLTPLLLWFAPVIWVGNAALVLAVKYSKYTLGWSYVKAVASGIVLKVLAIGGTAFALFSLKLIPNNFLYSMSILQLATATSAAIIFWPLFKARAFSKK